MAKGIRKALSHSLSDAIAVVVQVRDVVGDDEFQRACFVGRDRAWRGELRLGNVLDDLC